MSAFASTAVPQNDRHWKMTLLVAVVLFATTAAVYSSAVNNDFVEWDDQIYVYQQPRILGGIRWTGLLWATTANVCANWHPLTVMSLQLDAQLFGPTAAGFHRTSVFFHAANAALAFIAMQSITGCRWKSAIVAAFFALHPLRVESVAWISERKDVLSGFFFFLTLIAYAHYVRAPSFWRYLFVAFCLALGLCSKSMLVTTPCVLLLLDYWPFRRCLAVGAGRRFAYLFFEKVPLLVLSAVDCALTIVYQNQAIIHLARVPFNSRPENATRGYAAYLWQTCWPLKLSHFYPIPEASVVPFVTSIMCLVVFSVVAIWQRHRRPYLLVGWLWFLGMLVPVSGLIQVGFQQRADRYTYLPQLGPLLAAVWGMDEIVKKSYRATIVAFGLIAALLIGCAGLTVRQIPVWRNTRSLWQHAYLTEPESRLAIYSLICLDFAEGNRVEARRLADELIALEDERSHDFLLRLCETLTTYGEYEASVRAFNKALTIGPDAELYLSRGEALAILDRWDEAVSDYRQVTRLNPSVVPLQFCLAHALSKIGRQAESDQIGAIALQRFPRWPESAAAIAWKNATTQDANQKDRFKAVWLAEEASAIAGGRRGDFLDVLAAAYASAGQFENAVATAERALEIAENEQKPGPAASIRSRLELYKSQQAYVQKK